MVGTGRTLPCSGTRTTGCSAGIGTWQTPNPKATAMRDPGAGALAWQGLALAGLSAVAMAAYLLISRAPAPALGHSGLSCGLVAACAGLVVLEETLSVQWWAGIGGICVAAATATVRQARKTPAGHVGSS